jgi:hypothetical protein
LDDEFVQYCELNNISDIEAYAKKLFNEKFTSIKYPSNPFISITPIPVIADKVINKIKEKKTNLYGE